LGLKIESDRKTGMLRVVTPTFDGPAHKAGIRAGDIITQIQLKTDAAGNPLPKAKVISTKGMSVDEAYDLFLSKEGTSVTLTVIPAK
jgi:carboxyl-terminal processing protease